MKTFSQKHLEPQLEKKWPDAPETGLKVGMASSRLLAKKVGVPRTDHQEPVWAGKAVNYATKCAQQAERHEMVVTGSVWDLVQKNDYLAATCPCGSGPSTGLWSDVVIEKIYADDGESAGEKLTSCWCDLHGPEYCDAVLAGDRTRSEVTKLVEAVQKSQSADAFRRAQAKKRDDVRNIRRGLAMRNR